jgi:TPR repeat protein
MKKLTICLVFVLFSLASFSLLACSSDFDKQNTLAQEGDAEAQYKLGKMYYDGEGVTKNYQKAVEWLRKAAGQGLDKAQNSLGYMYANGYGVTKDYQKAVEWYRKAAEQGLDKAQTNLG